MLSIEQLDTLINELTEKKNQIEEEKRIQEEQRKKEEEEQQQPCFGNLAISEILVLIGLITGVLIVRAVRINNEQIVTISVAGSLGSLGSLGLGTEEGSDNTSIDSKSFNTAVNSLIERLKNITAEEYNEMIKELYENSVIEEEPEKDCCIDICNIRSSTILVIIGILTGNIIVGAFLLSSGSQNVDIILGGSLGEKEGIEDIVGEIFG